MFHIKSTGYKVRNNTIIECKIPDPRLSFPTRLQKGFIEKCSIFK